MGYSAIGCIVTLILSLLAAPLATEAQPLEKVPRVGYLSDDSGSLRFTAFEPLAKGLRELGYLGACPRISLISSLHRSLAYQLYAGGDATLVASPWLCNAIAAPEGRARRRGMPSEGAHTAKSARSTSP